LEEEEDRVREHVEKRSKSVKILLREKK